MPVGLAGAVPSAQIADPVERGNDHYFNLEYDEAIEDYREALKTRPNDPTIYNNIANSILFKELNRLGKLETSAFKGDNGFLIEDKPQPDPAVKQEFFETIKKSRELAEGQLEKNSKDRMALLALGHGYGLEANYEFMIDKSYFAALKNGQRARKASNQLIKLDPKFVDAYLIAGVQEYVVGSLPWAVRALIAIGGINGNKEKGKEWVSWVSRDGNYARNEARVLMSLLYRREGQPLMAAEVLNGLIEDFPRNYVMHFELGSMLVDGDKKPEALEVFRETVAKYQRKEPGFGRMPQRAVDALKRKIESLNEELKANPGSQAAARQR